MERFLWICLAGAAGTGARYLIAIWAAQRLGSAFPFGTLLVNLLGCFAIAAVMVLYWRRLLTDRDTLLRVIVAFVPTGLIGFFAYPLVKPRMFVGSWLWQRMRGGKAD